MVRRAPTVGTLLALAVLLFELPVRANGRFPRAERLLEKPGDPQRLYIAGTYGILTTPDRGRNWYHVCEASFSLQDGYQGDPLLEIMGDQSLLVGVQASINRSLDEGCQWSPVLQTDSTYVVDQAISRSEAATVIALIASYRGADVVYSLQQSRDDGATWTAIGAALPADLVYTIDIDPNDGSHLFATGLGAGIGQFLTSADRGSSWTTHPIAGADQSRAPYIAAIHPFDAHKIFVRTDAWVPVDGSLTADDALLYSGDGGATWSELFRSGAKLFGFALSPDGGTVLIGYGDPQEGAGQVVTGPLGVFKSSVEPFSFEPIFAGPVSCLAWTSNGVYVCGSQTLDGFELAYAPDANFAATDGGCLTPLLFLDEVRGPLSCGPQTSGAACRDAWPVACATFGACEDAGTKPRSCGAAAAPAASPAPSARSSSGCTYSMGRPQRDMALVAMALYGVIGACARRSRRASGRAGAGCDRCSNP